jgi:hypothetical protein
VINTPYIACLAAVALIAAAWVALTRICPNQDRHSCQAALLLCTLGMSIGLAIDAHEGRLALLDTLCRSGTRGPLYWIGIHWQQLPAMHDGMLAGSLLTLAYRPELRNLGCCAFMAAGMALGSLVHTPSIMLASMLFGMTCGHAAAVQIPTCLSSLRTTSEHTS